MPLVLHNTLTGKKELFEPAEKNHVRMYACGPTVYDYFHIGNGRAFVVFDTLRRVLLRRGYQVTFVQNITDVDDKIINRAKQEGRSAAEVAEQFTAAFIEDLAALGCRPADVSPRATEHMADILALIGRLVSSRHAYALDNGDVYFAVRSFKRYGLLAHKNIEELEEGARVEVDPRKRDPLDFALWKAAKPEEPSWPSPWGPGRPGWHIECSAMAMKYLGDSFDIHAGGEDLIFPHHENENAQSQSLTRKPLARVWLHNGFLKIEGEKMSKSLGNFRIVRDLLKVVPHQVLRLFLLSAHYRSPLDFNAENLDGVRKGYEEFTRTLERLSEVARLTPKEAVEPDREAKVFQVGRADALARFEAALDDDLNTAQAIGQLYALANSVKKLVAGKNLTLTGERQEALAQAHQDLLSMSEVLGIVPELTSVPDEIRATVRAREDARTRRDWPEADRLRAEVLAQGWAIEDTTLGPLINRALPAMEIKAE
jgi:cysteinyl-tRNA synthetase